MSSDKNIESFIYLGKNKISVSVFSEKNKLIFKKDLLIQKNYLDLDHNTYEFIEKSILEFESKNKIFLKKTNVIIDKDYFLETNISIKDKDYVVELKTGNINNIDFLKEKFPIPRTRFSKYCKGIEMLFHK